MRVLVWFSVTNQQAARLRACAPNAEFVFAQGDQARESAQEAEIILGNFPVRWLPECRKLRWLQLDSAGTEPYIKPGVLPTGAQLVNATGAYGLAISEYLLAGLLSMMKKLPTYYVHQKKHEWVDEGDVRSIEGCRALVVGLGDIGGTFAKKLDALGAQVYGIRRKAGEIPDFVRGMYGIGELVSVLPDMDVVASCLPGTSGTQGIFSREAFAAMKPGAFFLNIGRGSAVDTDALYDALVSGRLGGACLDVTDPEPLPAGHRLWDAPNVIVTPHVSGHFHLPETFERIIGICCENLRRDQAGEALKNVVNFETGYPDR